MTNCLKKFVIASSFLAVPLIFATPALAAAPDGSGPWADSAVSATQGLEKGGGAVPATRSDPTSALGVAEQTNAEGSFYSLGFGGTLTLAFVNGIAGGSMVFESTNLPYPTEKAKVEFSSNGVLWVNAGTVSRTGTVAQPRSVLCAHYVRITDISNKADFPDATADGYDVDGVKALGNNCGDIVVGPPVGGGCCCGNLKLVQKNESSIGNSVGVTSNTGDNKVKKNTNGANAVTTGDSNVNVAIGVGGSSNTANITGGAGCCSGGAANIIGNGAGSTNTIIH